MNSDDAPMIWRTWEPLDRPCPCCGSVIAEREDVMDLEEDVPAEFVGATVHRECGDELLLTLDAE